MFISLKGNLFTLKRKKAASWGSFFD